MLYLLCIHHKPWVLNDPWPASKNTFLMHQNEHSGWNEVSNESSFAQFLVALQCVLLRCLKPTCGHKAMWWKARIMWEHALQPPPEPPSPFLPVTKWRKTLWDRKEHPLIGCNALVHLCWGRMKTENVIALGARQSLPGGKSDLGRSELTSKEPLLPVAIQET